MSRDYAKQRQASNGNKKPARKKAAARTTNRKKTTASSSISGLRYYGLGVLSGLFISLLLYLGTLPGPAQEQIAQAPGADTDSTVAPPEPRFDFYTLLPEQTIDVEVEPADIAQPRSAPSQVLYFLQAGSFRQREDADRRRAELLLLGLEPNVEETSGDNGRWYRVFLGPFDSRSKMAAARSLTANQDIDTLLLKRG
tara:strand:- start:365995 stop:366585 length:591 start_codon:yes stop_codon:yes gene_type:complete